MEQAQNKQQNQEIVQKVVQIFEQKGFDLPTLQHFQQLASAALKNPQAYPELVQQAMQSGKIPQGEIPQQYDENFVKSITVALQIAIAHKSQQGGGQLKMPKGL